MCLGETCAFEGDRPDMLFLQARKVIFIDYLDAAVRFFSEKCKKYAKCRPERPMKNGKGLDFWIAKCYNTIQLQKG